MFFTDKKDMARAKKNKTSIGCLFWIALILLILVIFLFNRETIQTVLDETGFIEIVQKNREEKKPEIKEVPPKEEAPAKPEQKDSPEETVVKVIKDSKPSAEEKPVHQEEKKDIVEIEVSTEKPPEKQKSAPPVEDSHKVRRSKMYFIEVLDSGEIVLKSITRPVYYVDSPLTETMKTLLEGLSSSELNMGLITLIPDQTRLISISVKNNVAYINFSESFRFNSFGIEGYEAQLKQIVYTATEFSSVDSVQFLIEGKIEGYMGTEGAYIGEPLSRNDF